MSWSISFSPLIPTPFLIAGAVLALVFAGLLLLRRSRGMVWRIATLATLILALANPNLQREERKGLSNIALIVVDESASQTLDNRGARSQAIKKHLEEQLKAYPNLEIRTITSTNSGEGEKESTNLFADLNRGLSTIPSDRLAGVFVITDGQIHDAPKSPASLGLGAPLHTLLTGHKQEYDRRIEVIKAPRFGLVGSTASVELRIVETGDKNAQKKNTGQSVRLTIKRENQEDEIREVQIGSKVTLPITFHHSGENIIELDIEAAPNELTKANNRLAISAQGVRENLRVLLVSGEPHAGERTWRNLLKSDAAVDLVHFTILRPPEKQDGTPINQLSLIAFPTRELFSEKLGEFDLIIFDRYQRRGVLPLLYFDNIARYVENGGAVLVAAGEGFSAPMSLYRTPLMQILPAEPTGRVLEAPYRATLSDDGNRHPVSRDLPGNRPTRPAWGRWFRLIEAEPKKGNTLMLGANNKPLLVLNRVEKGRVALLLSDHAWLWARGYDGGGPYTALLRRLAHWLMKEPDLEEEFIRAKGSGKRLTIERRSMANQIDPVTLETPNGDTRQVTLEQVEPGLWRKTVEIKSLGLHKLKSGDLSALAHIGPFNSREMDKITASEDVLAPIMTASGGRAFWSTARAGLIGKAQSISPAKPEIKMLQSARIMHGNNWAALRDRKAYSVSGIKLYPLFSGLLALAALLGMICFTWFREGR